MANNGLFAAASTAFDRGDYEAMVRLLEPAVAAARDPHLWQLLGLARRGLLDSDGAVAAFGAAADLAPDDVRIAHALALATLEAGRPAADLYQRALSLAPTDAGLLVGHASAVADNGRGAEAEGGLRQLLRDHPGWHDGHAAFARLAAANGGGTDGTATVREALTRFPKDPALWRLLLRLLLDGGRHAETLELAPQATAAVGASTEWARAEAIALSELGRAAEAQRLFDRLPADAVANGMVQRVRNLIRLGRLAEATVLAEARPGDGADAVLWPYRALLWRVTGDERWQWLEGDPRLIGTYDLGLTAGEIEALATMLRALHQRSGQLPDQSVRRGTQTDGNLLARAEPEIVRLRTALLDAVQTHVAQLPPPVAGHPTLGGPRMPIRVSGSWSVRLSDAGFHVDHVHPYGWLSSACYVALPQADDTREEGWLAFGENRVLLPDLAGFRSVKPVVGQLVLFPSTMWHGTRPFRAGERLTVAFDIARPPIG